MPKVWQEITNLDPRILGDWSRYLAIACCIFALRTTINLCTLLAGFKKSAVWYYPEYVFRVIFPVCLPVYLACLHWLSWISCLTCLAWLVCLLASLCPDCKPSLPTCLPFLPALTALSWISCLSCLACLPSCLIF